jgi:uncharacterized membrane protein YfcA
MSATLMLALAATMIGTSFLSGIFGMAGGLILLGVLLALFPVPEAMVLHAITQMASNGWRSLLWFRHVHWRAASYFLSGLVVAFSLWTFWQYVPSKPVAFILLGLLPFVARLVPADFRPDPERFLHGAIYGSISVSMMLLAGVTGPIIDAFFLGGRLDRRQIISTKAFCQTFSHAAKLLYFGGLINQAAGVDPVMAGLAIAASMTGTSLARPVLEKLSDVQFRYWATQIVTCVALFYLLQGSYLLIRHG